MDKKQARADVAKKEAPVDKTMLAATKAPMQQQPKQASKDKKK